MTRGRRSSRYFGEMEKQDLLKAAGDCRRACTRASGQAPIGGDVYAACSGIMSAIDDLAETLTGRRDHFWVPLHSTPKSPDRQT